MIVFETRQQNGTNPRPSNSEDQFLPLYHLNFSWNVQFCLSQFVIYSMFCNLSLAFHPAIGCSLSCFVSLVSLVFTCLWLSTGVSCGCNLGNCRLVLFLTHYSLFWLHVALAWHTMSLNMYPQKWACLCPWKAVLLHPQKWVLFACDLGVTCRLRYSWSFCHGPSWLL